LLTKNVKISIKHVKITIKESGKTGIKEELYNGKG